MHYLLAILLLTACERASVPRDEAPTWDTVDRADLVVDVLDAEGDPVDEAWVTVLPGGRDALTDSDGTVTLAGLGQGSYRVVADAQGFQGAEQAVEVPEGGAQTAIVLTPLDVGAVLSGIVHGPDGAPVDGATVWVDGTEHTSTDGDGEFEVAGLSAGLHSVEIRGPEGSSLLTWPIEALELVEAGQAEVEVTLPGHGTGNYQGSQICSICHDDAYADWQDTLHSQAGRLPSEMVDDPTNIDEAFEDGRVVSLDPEVPGASVTLGSTGAAAWTAEVEGAGGSTTGALPVHEIYGGHDHGAAFAVQVGGSRFVLPVAWAAAGEGLSDQQHGPGFVPAFVAGWFDESDNLALDVGQPGDGASFALRCAGCHATGVTLEEGSSGFSLDGNEPDTRRVGCEACHGPAAEHIDNRSVRDILNPSLLPPVQRIDTCARCHERVTPDDHPFSAAPAWPVDAQGDQLGPHERLYDHATPDPEWWVAVPASKALGDQAGELRASPHRRGPTGYDGSCEDCHDPHGTDERADLYLAPYDNDLCVTCHRSRFPSYVAEAEHAKHPMFSPGTWGVGACTRCHMGRSGKVVRLDAVSGVGELRSHSLEVFRPTDILAEFDAAGVDELPPGEVPVSPCLDCHAQIGTAQGDFEGFYGPLYSRITYENLALLFDRWWGVQ